MGMGESLYGEYVFRSLNMVVRYFLRLKLHANLVAVKMHATRAFTGQHQNRTQPSTRSMLLHWCMH